VHYACGVKLEGAATVRCTLVAPSRVAHDFSDAALCCLALTLRITNGSPRAVAVRVRAPPTDAAAASAGARSADEGGLMPTMSSFQAPMQSMGEALWVGCTCQVCPLAPDSSPRGVLSPTPAPSTTHGVVTVLRATRSDRASHAQPSHP
jgi:hypothetical protein